MNKDILQKYFFITLLILVTLLVFFMFLPFLQVLVLAAIFAVVLHPLYVRVTRFFRGHDAISSVIVVLLFALCIIAPLFYFTTQILGEAGGLYTGLSNPDSSGYTDKITKTLAPVQDLFPNFTLDVGQYIRAASNVVVSHLGGIISKVFDIVTSALLVFFSLYFFLKDGSKFKATLLELSPMDSKYNEHVLNKIKIAIVSTVRGVLLVAVIQGILAGIGMTIFGVPNAALWGSVSAVASLVPGLGTALVFIPAIAYMLVIENTTAAIGLIFWGVFIVGMVDNFIGPYLYSRGVKIHQLIMLFAVLGGISLFGPIGFLFGPIVISLFFSLVEIYQTLVLKKEIEHI